MKHRTTAPNLLVSSLTLSLILVLMVSSAFFVWSLPAAAAMTPSPAAGELDPSFGQDGRVTTDFGGSDDLARDVLIQPDGKILVVGESQGRFALTRYNPGGSLDTTFGSGGRVSVDICTPCVREHGKAVVLQTDNKIIVAGESYMGSGTAEDMTLARYHSDGSLDTSFGNNGFTTLNMPVWWEPAYGRDIIVQSDGGLFVVGYTGNPAASGQHSYEDHDGMLARFHSNGSLDGSFGSGGWTRFDLSGNGRDDVLLSIVQHSNGQVTAAGYMGPAGSRDFVVTRFNLDGSLDASFGSDGIVITDFSGRDDIGRDMAIQPDGKIIVVGNSSDDFVLARFNEDGSLDTALDGDGWVLTDFAGNADVAMDVLLQTDGQIVVSGFTGPVEGGNFAIARYNPDGSLDSTFSGDGQATTDFGGGADNGQGLAIQPDGRLVVVGYTGPADNRDFAVARYNGTPADTPQPVCDRSVGTDYGNGCDGDLLVDSTTSVNQYHKLGADYTAGDMSIELADPTGLTGDREILVIQLRGSEQHRGQFEFARAIEVVGYSLMLENPLQYDYTSEAFVVTVPNYANVHVTANGRLSPQSPLSSSGVGGILAFRVQDSLTVDPGGQINADGHGFAGGDAGYIVGSDTVDKRRHAGQGDSHAGAGASSSTQAHPGANGAGGGGGLSQVSNSGFGGGAGAGHAFDGSPAGGGPQETRAQGGNAVGFLCLEDPAGILRIFAGSGGGGSGAYGLSPDSRLHGIAGGDGGGIILIWAQQIEAYGEISANGTTRPHAGNRNGAGGGAGGTIWISADMANLGNLSAEGGLGGTGAGPGSGQFYPRGGGSGSVGIVRVNSHLLAFSGIQNPDPCISEPEPPDTIPPTVVHVQSVADTGDGILDEGEVTAVSITQLTVTFSEEMLAEGPDSVTDPANYSLAGASNGSIAIDSVVYDDVSHTATLHLNGSNPLPDDAYTLTLVGSALADFTGNNLDGNNDGTGGDDFVLHFEVYTPVCVQAPSGLMSWWPGEGDASDLVGSNHGTLVNGADFAAGRVGQAFSFDGVDDYVDMGDVLDVIGPELSIELWFKQASETGTLLSKYDDASAVPNGNNGYMLYFQYPDNLDFRVEDGTSGIQLRDAASLTHDWADGQWHHAVGVWASGQGVKLFVDGQLQATSSSQTVTSIPDVSEEPFNHFTVGAISNRTQLFFGGLIDEVSVYNRGLSTAEVESLFSAGGAGKCLILNQPPDIEVEYDTNSVDEGQTATNTGTFSDPDGDIVTLDASVGTIEDNGDGTWAWTFETDDGGAQSQTVTITADDGNGGTAQTTFDLTVGNLPPLANFVNDGPVVEDTSATVSFTDQTDPSSADTAAGFHFAYDLDKDGTFEIGDGTYAGSVTDASATVPPAYLSEPGMTLVVGRIIDKDGGYSEAITEIVVNMANQPPTADAGGPYIVGEGESIVLDGSGSFDPDPIPVIFYAWDFDGDGQYDDATGMDPVFSASLLDGPNTVTIGLKVTDIFDEFDTDTAQVSISNRPPTAVDDAATVSEDGPAISIDVLANDSDPAGAADPLTINEVETTNTTGAVVFTDEVVNYEPAGTFESLAAGEQAIDSFGYTVDDGDGGIASATVEVTVNGVNDAPTATVTEAEVAVDEGQPAANSGGFWDVDHNAVVALSASVGTVVDNGNGGWSWTYTPDDGPAETQEVVITATDEHGAQGTATFGLTVNNVLPTAVFANDGPVDEGDSFTLTLTNPSDPSIADTAAGFEYAFDCGDGSGYGDFSGISSVICPTSDDGIRQVGGQIRDKDGSVQPYTVQITVHNVPPTVSIAVESGWTVEEGEPFTLHLVTFTDPGQLDTHTSTVNWGDGSPIEPGDLDGGSGAVSGSHTYLDSGEYTLSIQVCDEEPACVTVTHGVSIPNTPPTADFTISAATAGEGDTVTLTFANPTDPSSVDTAAGFTYAYDCDGDGVFEVDGSADAIQECSYPDNGLFTATGRVYDKDGDYTEYTTPITINNLPPTVDSPIMTPETSNEGETVTASATFSDAGGNDAPFSCTVDYGDGTGPLGGVIGDNLCTGPAHTYTDDGHYPVTVLVTDKDDDDGAAPHTIYEVYNVAPTITLSGDDGVDEGSVYTLTLGSITDPGDDVVSRWIVHWGDGNSDTFARTGEVTHIYADGPSGYDILVDLADEDGVHGGAGSLTMAVHNVAPTVADITAPLEPVMVNAEISASALFTDPGVLDSHTAVWEWGDTETSSGVVEETDGSGSVSGSHVYATPGVYTLRLTVTDKDGESDSTEYRYVVVYDPEGGFVTGGGWIDSPEGAYAPDPSLTGKANFGFVSKYKKGANVPTGETEFQFKSGDLNFHSESYQWLVVAGAKAMFKGDGAINGGGDYGFMLSAIDAALTPSIDTDRFRIKIWDKDNGDAIVYDNQMNDDDDADATTEIRGGNIVIHNKGGKTDTGENGVRAGGMIYLPIVSGEVNVTSAAGGRTLHLPNISRE